jgi:hypothetical protein
MNLPNGILFFRTVDSLCIVPHFDVLKKIHFGLISSQIGARPLYELTIYIQLTAFSRLTN